VALKLVLQKEKETICQLFGKLRVWPAAVGSRRQTVAIITGMHAACSAHVRGAKRSSFLSFANPTAQFSFSLSTTEFSCGRQDMERRKVLF
jgi:hypothetical protein